LFSWPEQTSIYRQVPAGRDPSNDASWTRLKWNQMFGKM